jgi:hypothetical protein
MWVRHRDEIVDLLRDILKVMAPEQIQQRWHKGVASVLYTYAIVSNQNICIYIYIYIYIHSRIFFRVHKPWKQSIAKEMNNDNDLKFA